MSTVHDPQPSAAGSSHSRGCTSDRVLVMSVARLDRLRAGSGGRIMLSIDPACQLCLRDAMLLDHVGARLTSALAGPVGGRITVSIERQGDDVVLEVRTARPGSWKGALQQVSFHNLVAQLSESVAKRGGMLAISVGPFGRLNAAVRLRATQAAGEA
jgi:hypothetical protein